MAYGDWRERADSGWAAKGEQKYGHSRDVGEPLPAKPDPYFDAAVKSSEKFWRDSQDAGSTMWKLRMCVAHMANLDRDIDHGPIHAERVLELKGTVANLLRDANPAEVLGHPRVRELVMTLYGEGGINRLLDRAARASHG